MVTVTITRLDGWTDMFFFFFFFFLRKKNLLCSLIRPNCLSCKIAGSGCICRFNGWETYGWCYVCPSNVVMSQRLHVAVAAKYSMWFLNSKNSLEERRSPQAIYLLPLIVGYPSWNVCQNCVFTRTHPGEKRNTDVFGCQFQAWESLHFPKSGKSRNMGTWLKI